MEELIDGTLQWAEQKGILEANDAQAQIGKFLEEATELKNAIDSLDRINGICDMFSEDEIDDAKLQVKLELGDVLVTLIIQAKLQGTTLNECLGLALAKITKRTGRMVDGVFVKDE